jgi:hypothetical protein
MLTAARATVRDAYGVPAQRGMHVKVNGKVGAIARLDAQYIYVRFASGPRQVVPCHPTWRVTYFSNEGTELASYGD